MSLPSLHKPFAAVVAFELFWVSLLGLPLILPNKIVSITWHPYLLIALFLFWPLHRLGWFDKPHRKAQDKVRAVSIHPLSLNNLLLLACFPLSIWASVDRQTSWSAAGYILWGIALCEALIHWVPARHKPAVVAWFLLAGGSLFSLLVLPIVAWKPQFLLFHLPLYDQLRSLGVDIGETIHANVLASVIVLLLPLLLALSIRRSISSFTRIGLIVVFSVLLGIMILTQSRGAYLATLATLAFVLLLRWPRLLTIGLGMLVLVGGLSTRFDTAQLLDLISTDGSLGGWAGRFDIWRQSFNAIYDFSFTGIGYGTFTLIIPLLYPLQVSVEGYPHAHNLFLQIGVDLGVPGLIAYTALLCTLFAMLIPIVRNGVKGSLHHALAIGSLASLLAMLIHGLLDAAIWVSKIAFFPWILFALITVLFLNFKENNNKGSLPL